MKKGFLFPKAAALQIIMSRFTYKADLITHKIEIRRILYKKFIKNKKMNNKLWDELGITLEKYIQEHV